MMQWNKLLTRQRLGKDKPEKPEDARTSFQRDYDRLVFSSPFRRLKDKTQVFSLAKNDYIRTRLIHSLEVSCVGRSLGTIVGYGIKERHKLDEFTASDFGDIVAAACLAHDIGNPPFGHAGEDAIRTGFQSWYETVKEQLTLTDQEKADLDLFEGNAQGFRILTTLEMQPRRGGIQLTCPTLAAFTKYPRESLISTDILNDYSGKSAKKHGFFQDEKILFAIVADTVGLIRRSPDVAWWSRHPLAFLVEAADDICYHIVDLEDGYRMGYISFKKAKKLLNDIAKRPNREINANTKEEQIKFLRAVAINNIVQEVATIFLEHEEELLAGTFDSDLISLTSYAETLNSIQSKTRKKVFNHPEVVGIQVAGYEVIGHLFAEFANANLYSTEKGKLLKLMLPKELCPPENESSYRKILKITDYISGMTDSYATTLFQELKGISLR
jgi:dGTPase